MGAKRKAKKAVLKRHKGFVVLCVLALLCALLSLFGLLDFQWGWGLCGGAGCADPRWKRLGSFGEVPLAGLGVALYTAVLLQLIHFIKHPLAERPFRRTALCVQVGTILGTHVYLTWIQHDLLHAWCVVCITTALLGALLSLVYLVYVFQARRLFWPLICVGIGVGPVLLLYQTHRHLFEEKAPDPLVRPAAPAIYRPEPLPSEAAVPSTLVERMRRGMQIDTAAGSSALLSIEVFLDFQCKQCAELEIHVWPAVLKQLGEKRKSLSTTYRIFLLEGHPLGWRAAFLALAAGVNGNFLEAKDAFYLRQAVWVRSGDVVGVLRGIPSIGAQADMLLNPESTMAAKLIIREDVSRGASLGVKASPSLVLTPKGSDKPLILRGVKSVASYTAEIFRLLPEAEADE